jgi:ketosteroid isomerase-like protein
VNRSVVQAIYAAAAAGDFAGVEAVLADDVVLIQCDNHPTPGVWRGRADAMKGLSALFEALRTTGVEVHEVVADGPERVVGLMEAKGLDSRGEPYSMPVAELFLVRDGKIAEIRPYYYDTVRLRQLVGVA